MAALLDVLLPGAGHYALGSWRQALAWFGINVVPWLAVIGAGLAASKSAFWIGTSGMVLSRLAGAADCFRQPLRPRPRWQSVAIAFATATAAVLWATDFVKAELVEAFRLPSQSMYPTLRSGDHIIVSKVSRPVSRGEIVAFRSPRKPDEVFVKRIVAISGDTIEMRNDVVFVNDNPITRTNSPSKCTMAPVCQVFEEVSGGNTYQVAATHDSQSDHSFQSVHVPPDAVFVLGDNRERSVDSRFFGAIPVRDLIGRVQFTWLALSPEEAQPP